MDVDGVKRPLVVLQDRRGGHRFIVLGADDDDDQIALLWGVHNLRITTAVLASRALPSGDAFTSLRKCSMKSILLMLLNCCSKTSI